MFIFEVQILQNNYFQLGFIVLYVFKSYLNRSAVGVTKIFDKGLWPGVIVAHFLHLFNNTNLLLMIMLMLQLTSHKILTNSMEGGRANSDQPQFLSLLMGTCNSWKWRNVVANTMVLPLLSFPASGFCLQWENMK